MREFFRGWKRKIGVFTLLIACVFIAGWIRSLKILDELSVPFLNHSIEVESSDGDLVVSLSTGQSNLGFKWESNDEVSFSYATQDEIEIPKPVGLRELIAWRTCVMSDGTAGTLIPYSSIIIPLTILSAWLLLSKQPPVEAKVQP